MDHAKRQAEIDDLKTKVDQIAATPPASRTPEQNAQLQDLEVQRQALAAPAKPADDAIAGKSPQAVIRAR